MTLQCIGWLKRLVSRNAGSESQPSLLPIANPIVPRLALHLRYQSRYWKIARSNTVPFLGLLYNMYRVITLTYLQSKPKYISPEHAISHSLLMYNSIVQVDKSFINPLPHLPATFHPPILIPFSTAQPHRSNLTTINTSHLPIRQRPSTPLPLPPHPYPQRLLTRLPSLMPPIAFSRKLSELSELTTQPPPMNNRIIKLNLLTRK